MKSRIVLLIAVLIVSSCTKDESINGNLSSRVVFSAEAENGFETKTAINYDGTKYVVEWVNGDLISVTDADNDTATFIASNVDGKRCTFTKRSGDELSDPSTYYAVYPSSLNTGSQYVLPETQTYVSSTDASEFPMVAKSQTSSLMFKNLCGIIRLGIRTSQSDIYVRRITVKDASSSPKALSGPITIDWDALSVTSVSGTNGVSLDCSEANSGTGVLLSNTASFFNIAVPAGTYIPQITVETMDGCTQTMTSSKQVTITSGVFNNYNIYPCEIVWDYAYGTANCILAYNSSQVTVDITPYVVNADCTIGAVALHAPAAVSAEIVWYEATLGKPSISDFVSGTSFKVGLDNSKYGNALIAIKDANNTILWSYHIWKPEADPTATLHYTSIPTGACDVQIMPFYLGAMKVPDDKTVQNFYATAGNYFQRGRKDPMIRPSAEGTYCTCYDSNDQIIKTHYIGVSSVLGARDWNTAKYMIDYSEAHPDYFLANANLAWTDDNSIELWKSSKTVYDPCPDGYKLTPFTPYQTFTTNGQRLGPINNVSGYNYGNLVYYNGTKDDNPLPETTDYYPCTGMISSGGGYAYLTPRTYLYSTDLNSLNLSGTTVQWISFKPLTSAEAYMTRCVRE